MSKTSKARRDAKRKQEAKTKRAGKPASSADRPVRWMIGTRTSNNLIPVRDGAQAILIFTDAAFAHTIAQELTAGVTAQEKELVFDAVGAEAGCSSMGINAVRWTALRATQPCRIITTREEFEEAQRSLAAKFEEQMLPD